jgi:hypothetical protein
MFCDAMSSPCEEAVPLELVRALRVAVAEAARHRQPRSVLLRARVFELVDELRAAGAPPGVAFFRVRSIIARMPEYHLFPPIVDGVAGWCLERYFSGPTPERGPTIALRCLAGYLAVSETASGARPPFGCRPSRRPLPSGG